MASKKNKKNKKVRQKHQHQHHLPKCRHRNKSQHEKAPRNEVPPVMVRADDNQGGNRTNGVLNKAVGKEKAPRNEVPPVMVRADDNQGGNRTNGALNKVVGKETVVYVDKFDTLGILEVKAKCTPTDLEYLLPDGTRRFWVVNENVHETSNCLKGLVFISHRHNKIGIIVKALGSNAIVETVHPVPDQDEQFWILDLDSEIYYLEQLGGPPIADPFAGRTKQLYGDGTVKPLVDEFNFVKVNVGGPDLVAHSRCPQFDALKSELKDRHKKLWDTSSSGTSRGLREGKELDDLVPTLYIYEHEEGAMKKAARQHLYSVPLSSASTYNEHFNEIEMAWLTKLNADDFIALEKEGKWKCWEDCAAWLTSHSVTTDRYLVPNLEAIGGLEEFRFKSITAEELECLEGWENPFCHGDYTYVLGVEPRALTNELCFGVLLAMSGFDPLLTKTTMTYYGASMMAECIRRGFKRTTIGHYGMNGYNNERMKVGYVPTPMEAVADKAKLQMHRAAFAGHGLKPQLVRISKNLTTAALQFTEKRNPLAMEVTNHLPGLKIATCGFRNGRNGGTKKKSRRRSKKKQKCNNLHILETRTAYKPQHLVYGFCNTSHVDCDYPTRLERTELCQRAVQKKCSYTENLLKSKDYPGLPTTCAWQLVFRNETDRNKLTIHQYFTMHGLGVALPIQHGLGHHFFGGSFEHNTSFCLVEAGGEISASNSDDHFMVFAWGASKKVPAAELQGLIADAAVPLVRNGRIFASVPPGLLHGPPAPAGLRRAIQVPG